MDAREDIRLSPDRYRAAAAALVKLPFYLIAFSSGFAAFGFWKTVLLAALFAVCGGRRAVSAVAARLVRNLPGPRKTVEKPSTATGFRRNVRPSQALVIDLDPSEYSRTKL